MNEGTILVGLVRPLKVGIDAPKFLLPVFFSAFGPQ